MLALHYTAALPFTAAVVAGAAGLAALARRSRLLPVAVFAAVAAVVFVSVVAAGGSGVEYAGLALALAAASLGLSYASLSRGWDPARLLRVATYLVIAGWIVYWIPFVTLDYSLHEVFWNTSPGLPLWMRFASAWSGGGGSLFLFTLMASLGALYMLRSRRVEASTGLVAGLAAVIVVGVAAAALNDAFTLMESRPASGAGLNPLLKSPWLYPHPLSTFGGYALLAVAAVGLLAGAERRRAWVVYEAGWGLLTLGIMLGAYWSYETFGWGGYWAWDPVETSELMVWLASTLLPHAVVVASSLEGFTAAFTGSSVFIAMYVTRTGLSPLHSFAAPGIGALILLASGSLLLVYAIYLLALRGDDAARQVVAAVRSRRLYQVGMLVAALSLAAAALIVYASLFVPSLLVALGKSVSVPQMEAGVAYFHPKLYPLLIVMLAAIPAAFLGDRLGWRGYAALLIATGAVAAVYGYRAYHGVYTLAPLSPATTNAMMAFGLPWAGLAAAATITYLYLSIRSRGLQALRVDRLVPISLIHLGLAITVIGVLLSGTYAFNRIYTWSMTLQPGSSIVVPGGAKLVFENYSFGISNSTVDIYTDYVGRSAIYFWAQMGLQALAMDLGHYVLLYRQGEEIFKSNDTIMLVANLSKESPIVLNNTVVETSNASIYLVSFNVKGGEPVRAPLYQGPARIILSKPKIQVMFNVNLGGSHGEPPSVWASMSMLVDNLTIKVLKPGTNIAETKVGFHQALEIRLAKPINITIKPGVTVSISRVNVYSEAMFDQQHGRPLVVKGAEIRGPNAYLDILRGLVRKGRVESPIPLQLPNATAVYVAALIDPQRQHILNMLRNSSLWLLLEKPQAIFNLTVSKACLSAGSGCLGYVAAPRTVPETAWLDIRLRIETPGGERDVKVRIRFEAYGEIQGIHGLVSKVIHPSLGLDDVYVVLSPPIDSGIFTGAPYHELLLYYLHQVFKKLPPSQRLALTALFAAGYNIDRLKRMDPRNPQAAILMERSIVELYLMAEKFNVTASQLRLHGLDVEVKVIPGVRLVWLGPSLMALSAFYAAAAAAVAAARRNE